MLRRARRFVTRLVELRRLLEEGTEQLIAIMGTAKRVVFEVAELALFLYALWLVLGRH